VLAQKKDATPSGIEVRDETILELLADIVTGAIRIRRKHSVRLRSGKRPRFFALPSTKRSYEAQVLLSHHGSAGNFQSLVTKNLVSLEQLKKFAKRRRLTESTRGKLATALQSLSDEEIARKAAEAAAYSGGNGITGELGKMIAEETANGTVPLTDSVPAAQTDKHRLARSRQ
jgi:hypothetical protein